MYDGNAQSVFRCEQCNKPFDKQSTLKRHGYYCRSRRAGHTVRARSCIACAKGKLRCDNRRPECSRCLTRGVECHYPAAKAPKGSAPVQVIQHSNSTANGGQRDIAHPWTGPGVSLSNHREANNQADVAFDNTALALSNAELENLGDEYLDWNALQHIDFVDFLSPQTNEGSIQYPSSGPTSPPLTDRMAQVPQQAILSRDTRVSIPSLPSRTPRLLVQRPKVKTGSQRVHSLILHTLKSYLRTMMNHGSLPPFIHPRSVSIDAENNNCMNPLTNCISLVRMIGGKFQGSRKSFWEGVSLECERMCDEHARLNKWEMLGAMQALSIYVLVRLDEGETDHNNIDFLLLAAVTTIAKQLAGSDTTFPAHPGIGIKWDDWVFEESRRRLSVIYRVVNMLVYFEPAAMCDLPTDLLLAPLPARKQLWEAGDESAWKSEREREPGAHSTAFGLAANGDLFKLHENDELYCGSQLELIRQRSVNSASETPSSSAANWEEWCSGMDEIGGLIMLAAALVGQ